MDSDDTKKQQTCKIADWSNENYYYWVQYWLCKGIIIIKEKEVNKKQKIKWKI